MKRFWRETTTGRVEGGWQVALDGRALKTQGGAAQIVPTAALADVLAEEWRAQGETIDPAGFPNRDLADYAIDHVAPDPAATVAELLRYAESDTLCYRADPEDPLYRRQQDIWEPLVAAFEAREIVRLPRVSGVGWRAPDAALAQRLGDRLRGEDAFTLAALKTLAGIAASLIVPLAALEPGADAAALFDAANLEEDWQIARWGADEDAVAVRALRLAAFAMAAEFARLARSGTH